MARFWTRLFHSSKKKKLPLIVFDNYAQSKHLKESHMYGKCLVRVDKLQNAYCHLQQQQQKSHQTTFWRFMDPFVQTWYSELERVCRTSESALIMLNTQLEEVSSTITFISSPLKNQNRKSLKRAHQFIAACLGEWESQASEASSAVSSADLFQKRFQSLKYRVQQEIGSHPSPRLYKCIRQVFRFKQDLHMYHYYITSQFDMLWDLGRTAMQLESTADVPLLQVMKSRWQQKYTHQLLPYKALEKSFYSLLKKSTPVRQDFTCAVCLCLWREPTTLQCNHTFCRNCVQHMVCARCHNFRRKTVNRISEGLVHWIKPSPAVYCTCQSLDQSGQMMSVDKKTTCPLCRAPFSPSDCAVDEELSKFMALYFPKSRKGKEEEEEERDDNDHSHEYAGRQVSRKRKSTNTAHINSRRRSQTNATAFYSKMQRWSNYKWGQQHQSIITDNHTGQPPAAVPHIPLSSTHIQVNHDILALTRQSWLF